MEITGGDITIECEDTIISAWVNRDILKGSTYPLLPFVEDVQVIFDVGANCGATSVFLATCYPDAQVHAFEPAVRPRARLERNAAGRRIRVHPFGLWTTDAQLPLYYGVDDSITASLLQRDINQAESETIELRAAGPWARAEGISRIDVLKVDVEGVEVEVLESLAPLLPTVKVLYVEYDSRVARRAIDRLVEGTHELYRGSMFLDQGECVYVRKEIVDHPEAGARLLELYRESIL